MKYKIQVKQLEEGKWHQVDLNELVDTSISSYIKDAQGTVIACIYQDDTPMAFLTNSEKYQKDYETKGLSIHIDDFIELVGAMVSPSLLVKVFEGATLAEVIVNPEGETNGK
jgi:hypothetical protein